MPPEWPMALISLNITQASSAFKQHLYQPALEFGDFRTIFQPVLGQAGCGQAIPPWQWRLQRKHLAQDEGRNKAGKKLGAGTTSQKRKMDRLHKQSAKPN